MKIAAVHKNNREKHGNKDNAREEAKCLDFPEDAANCGWVHEWVCHGIGDRDGQPYLDDDERKAWCHVLQINVQSQPTAEAGEAHRIGSAGVQS